MKQLTELEAGVQAASDRLADALLAGDDTAATRQTLDDARSALQSHQDAVNAAEQEHLAAEAARADEIAATASARAVAEVQEQIARVELPEGADAPSASVDEVAAAAATVARMEHGLVAGNPDRPRLQQQADALAARIKAKQDEAGVIRSRRAAGDERKADAANLHLLDQDIADLKVLQTAFADKAKAMQPSAAAVQEVAAAKENFIKARNAAILNGLIDRQRVIESLLGAGARAIRAEAMRQGIRNLGSVYLPGEVVRDVAAGRYVS